MQNVKLLRPIMIEFLRVREHAGIETASMQVSSTQVRRYRARKHTGIKHAGDTVIFIVAKLN